MPQRKPVAFYNHSVDMIGAYCQDAHSEEEWETIIAAGLAEMHQVIGVVGPIDIRKSGAHLH